MSILGEYSLISPRFINLKENVDKNVDNDKVISKVIDKNVDRDLFGGQEAPNFDLHNLEGTATDAVHLDRHRNAGSIINPINLNADKNVEKVSINNKR